MVWGWTNGKKTKKLFSYLDSCCGKNNNNFFEICSSHPRWKLHPSSPALSVHYLTGNPSPAQWTETYAGLLSMQITNDNIVRATDHVNQFAMFFFLINKKIYNRSCWSSKTHTSPSCSSSNISSEQVNNITSFYVLIYWPSSHYNHPLENTFICDTYVQKVLACYSKHEPITFKAGKS